MSLAGACSPPISRRPSRTPGPTSSSPRSSRFRPGATPRTLTSQTPSPSRSDDPRRSPARAPGELPAYPSPACRSWANLGVGDRSRSSTNMPARCFPFGAALAGRWPFDLIHVPVGSARRPGGGAARCAAVCPAPRHGAFVDALRPVDRARHRRRLPRAPAARTADRGGQPEPCPRHRRTAGPRCFGDRGRAQRGRGRADSRRAEPHRVIPTSSCTWARGVRRRASRSSSARSRRCARTALACGCAWWVTPAHPPRRRAGRRSRRSCGSTTQSASRVPSIVKAWEQRSGRRALSCIQAPGRRSERSPPRRSPQGRRLRRCLRVASTRSWGTLARMARSPTASDLGAGTGDRAPARAARLVRPGGPPEPRRSDVGRTGRRRPDDRPVRGAARAAAACFRGRRRVGLGGGVGAVRDAARRRAGPGGRGRPDRGTARGACSPFDGGDAR